ncbi:MAG: FUSC family protein [Neisseriaceae bacterium]|nr:MAG: FUSC family protein [Neisseriaceae bacterium]
MTYLRRIGMGLKKILLNYFDDDRQINLIALQTSFFGLVLALLYVSKFHKIELIIIMTGLLMNSVMLSFNSSQYHPVQRINYGLITSIASGIVYGIGCFAANNIWLSTLCILIILPWVIFSNQSHGLIAGLFLYTFEGFILGSGMPANDLNTIIRYSLSYTFGGSLIVFSGIIRLFVLEKAGLNSNQKSIINNLPYLEINIHKVAYNIIMIFTVMLCNYISIHYHLTNGYWLPLTAFLIIKSNHALSISRITLRIIGTLIGGGVALACCLLIHSQLIFALMIFPVFYLTVIAVSRHYGSFTALITLSVLLIIALMRNETIYKIEYRVIYTLFAVLIVMLFLYILKFILTKTSVAFNKLY